MLPLSVVYYQDMTNATHPRDDALKGILLTNAATLIIALWQQWSVLQLMWPFWMQSLIIGWYARQRMLKLQQFCTADMKINNRRVEPSPRTQRQVANFFALHFGGFHAGYLFFLIAMTSTTDAAGFITVTNESTGIASPVYVGQVHPLDFVVYAFLSLGFWRSHRASHLEHVRADLGGTPKLGNLMMLPYARVIPMHLTIIAGVPLGGVAVWVFVVLKIAADVVMHKVEHRVLQGPKPEAVPT